MRMLIAATRMFAASPKLAAAVVASIALISFGQAANAVSYSTSGLAGPLTGLGDTLGTGYDTLTVQGVSGTIAPGTITLNTLTFTAGINAIVPKDYVGVFSFVENVTIGSGTAALTVPFNLSINYSDTLSIIGGTTLSILAGPDLWTLVLNPLTIGPNSGGSEVASLTAQVSESPATTPLPAALVLFGSGLGAMGLFGRRRKLKASAA
jgi:PEP-CTERM motif-containing protein